jgi:hypothetical protein
LKPTNPLRKNVGEKSHFLTWVDCAGSSCFPKAYFHFSKGADKNGQNQAPESQRLPGPHLELAAACVYPCLIPPAAGGGDAVFRTRK